MGSKFFPFRVDAISEGRKNNFDWVASPESELISQEEDPFSEGMKNSFDKVAFPESELISLEEAPFLWQRKNNFDRVAFHASELISLEVDPIPEGKKNSFDSCLPWNCIDFPGRRSFLEGPKNNFDRVAFHESVLISLEEEPF